MKLKIEDKMQIRNSIINTLRNDGVIEDKIKLNSDLLNQLIEFTPKDLELISNIQNSDKNIINQDNYKTEFYQILLKHFDLSKIDWKNISQSIITDLKNVLVEVSLEMFKNNQRLFLPSELLKRLLFFEVQGRRSKTNREFKEKKQPFYLPNFEGIKVGGLDLKGLPFINRVVWDIVDFAIQNGKRKYDVDMQEFSYEIHGFGTFYKKGYYEIDMSWSNIEINFLNNIYGPVIRGVNFFKTNLEFSHLEKCCFLKVCNCNFKETNVLIDSDELTNRFKHCSFSNNNYKDVTLKDSHLFGRKKVFEDCNFNNTGLKLDLDVTKNSQEIKHLLDIGSIQGCFLNGKYIKTAEESKKMKTELQTKYNNYHNSCKKEVEQVLVRTKKEN